MFFIGQATQKLGLQTDRARIRSRFKGFLGFGLNGMGRFVKVIDPPLELFKVQLGLLVFTLARIIHSIWWNREGPGQVCTSHVGVDGILQKIHKRSSKYTWFGKIPRENITSRKSCI